MAAIVALALGMAGVILMAPTVQAAVVDPFSQIYDKVVYGDFILAGNAVLKCPTGDTSCANGAARSDNTQVNDTFPMAYADVDAIASTFNSSSARVTLPPGSTVDYALLSWGGSTGTTKKTDGTLNTTACTNAANALNKPAGAPATQAVSLSLGPAAATSVVPGEYSAIATSALASGQQQLYSAETVVTSAFTGAATGSPLLITVGNVWTPQGRNCDGGWGLTLVYAYPDINPTYAPNRREVFVYDGHVMQFSTDPATDVTITGFRSAGGTAARVGVIAYEGDNGIGNDTFAVNGTNIAEPTTGATANFFNSTAERQTSPNTPNNYNIDVKSFDVSSTIIKPGDTSAKMTFATSGDSYLAQRLVLSTPIPDLRITKAAAPSQVRPGDTVTYTISVNNPSAVSANTVAVTDSLVAACNRTIGTMAAGATVTYTCAGVAPANDFTNSAVVNGATSLGDPLTDTALAPVDVIHPSVGLTKTADRPAYRTGDTVTFTIAVTNTGDVPLTGVAVADAKVPGCDRTVSSLAVGATSTWTCTTTAPVPGGSNTATVSGNDTAGVAVSGSATVATPVIAPDLRLTKTVSPAVVHEGDTATFTLTARNTGDSALTAVTVADPLVPGCARTFGSLAVAEVQTWTCTTTAGAADLVNTATATGTDGSGQSLSRTASATLDVVHPALSIVTTTGATRYRAGDAVVFTVRLRNTGDVDLLSTTATDPTLADCDRTVGLLAVGADVTWTCTGVAGSADYVNTVNASGTDRLGLTVNDTGRVTVDVVAPALTLTKTADLAQARVGDTVTFTLTVRNTGDTDLSDVAVVDPSTPACDRSFTTLALGASRTWTCTVVAGTDDFVNAASASGQPPIGPVVGDTATVAVDVIHPAVTLTKTASRSTVRPGDAVSYTVVVRNTGDVTLNPVVVADPLATGCDASVGLLAAGATRTLTCTAAAGSTSFVNQATVTGTPPRGPAVTASGTAAVTVVDPSVRLVKTAVTPVAHVGDPVTFRITVTNTGDTALTGISVIDGLAISCAGSLIDLTVGGSTTYTCVMPAPADDVTNRATVTASAPGGPPVTDTGTASVDVIHPAVRLSMTSSPAQVAEGDTVTFTVTARNTGDVPLTNAIVSDALAPGCSRTVGSLAVGASTTWTCTLVAGRDDVLTLATIGADDPLALRVLDTASAPVDVVHPGLVLSKSVSPSRVVAGQLVTYTLEVTNVGDLDLTGVDVADPDVPACDRTGLALTAGQTRTWTCTLTAPSASFTNEATATARPAIGPALSTAAGARLNVDRPGISVAKTALTTAARPGAPVTFRFVVTDTGDTTLSAVVSNDPSFAACDAALAARLSPGETWTYDCTIAAPLADILNTAVVSGQPPVGPRVTGTGTAFLDVVNPGLTVRKTGPSGPVRAGDVVTFTVSVENTGDDLLTNVALRDALAPGCNRDVASLAVGAVVAATCTMTAPADDVTNTATAAATDSAGIAVTGADSARVDVMHPAVLLEKFGPADPVREGQAVLWTVRVTNTGDVPLSGIAVTDPRVSGCALTRPSLAPGQSATTTCSEPAGPADMTNAATGTGDDPSGRAVTDTDTARADVIAPSVAVAVIVPNTPVLAGTLVTVTVTVTNDGDTDLTGVRVTDPALPACDRVVGALAIGASTTYTCVVTAPAGDLAVAVRAVGTPPAGATVAATASTSIDVVHPAVAVTLDGPAAPVHTGDTVTWTVTVTNTGDSAIAPLDVTVPGAPACTRTLAALAPGASTTYPCSSTAPSADVTLVATVVGTDVTGSSVTATDPAPLVVIHPDVSITVVGPVTTVASGDRATFTVTVTNTGDTALSGVAVTVPGLSDCTRSLGALATGASVVYTCRSAVLLDDLAATASVSGSDVTGLAVTDTAPIAVDVIHPAMVLTKTGPTGVVQVGDPVSFTLEVRNTGDADWAMMTVTDPTLPACDRTIGSLAVGAFTTWTCSTVAGADDLVNDATAWAMDTSGGTGGDTARAVVDVVHPDLALTLAGPTTPVHEGDPVTFLVTVTNTGDVAISGVQVRNAVAPGCDRDSSTFSALAVLAPGATASWSCTLVAPADDVTTTAVVTGLDDRGGILTRSAQAVVDVVHPSISVGITGPTAAVRTGDTVTFTVVVRNTGDVALTDARVTDAQAPGCARGPRALAVGETWTFTCTMTAPADDITNAVTAAGTDALGLRVSSFGGTPVDVMHPRIRVVKTAQTTPALPGGTATWTLTVLNTGDVTLRDVSVDDPLVADCTRPVRDLPVDDAVTWTCSGPAPADDITNVATGTGADPSGRSVTDVGRALLDVVHPQISLTETGPTAPVHPGDPITFTVVLTNTGDAQLTDARVTGTCPRTVPVLAPGQTLTWSCSTTAPADDVVDTASVTASEPSGSQVGDTASAPVDVIHPALSVTKTGPALPVRRGAPVSFTVVVTNTGDVDLRGVTLADALAPSCDANVGLLAAGASRSVTCTMTAPSSDFVNLVTATGDDVTGLTLRSAASAPVDVVSSDIDLVMTGPGAPVRAGDVVTFTLVLRNNGTNPLTSVTVADADAPGCARTFAALAAGEVQTWTCTTTAGTVDLLTTATATGTDAALLPVSDSGTAAVDVIHPQVTITTTGPTAPVRVGDPVTYLVTVLNSGDTPLTAVTVADALVPACDRVLGDLAPGASVTYGCTAPAPLDDQVMAATATGTDLTGRTVLDSDTAGVDVIHPLVTIDIVSPATPVRAGDVVTFTVTVRNTGDAVVDAVTVDDPLVADCVRSLGSMAPGETRTYTCTVTAGTVDVATTVTAIGTDVTGGTVSASARASFDVMAPRLALSVSVPPAPVHEGDAVLMTVTVTNTGDVTLTGVSVGAGLPAGCAQAVGSLAAGETRSWTCTVVAPATDVTFPATATGSDPLGVPVTDLAAAALDVIHPALLITASGPTAPVHAGDPVSFDLVVTNVGDVDLTGVVVASPAFGSCARTIGTLGAGVSTRWTCSGTAPALDLAGTATARGNDPVGLAVASAAPLALDVIHPAVTVSLSPQVAPVRAGDPVTVTVTVTNAGDVDLSDVQTITTDLPGCDRTFATLAVGQTRTYTCTLPAAVDDASPVVAVRGLDPVGTPVRDRATTIVDVVRPGLDVALTGPTTGVHVGDVVTFSVTVTNNGDSPVTDVAVSDPRAAGCRRSVGTLAAGESRTWTCTLAAGVDDWLETVSATGRGADGRLLQDTASAPVDVEHPALSVVVTVPPRSVQPGESVTVTVTVRNIGDVPLTGVVLTDRFPGCDPNVGDLAPGQEVVLRCVMTAPQDDQTPRATAGGRDPLGSPTTAGGDGTLDVVHAKLVMR